MRIVVNGQLPKFSSAAALLLMAVTFGPLTRQQKLNGSSALLPSSVILAGIAAVDMATRSLQPVTQC